MKKLLYLPALFFSCSLYAQQPNCNCTTLLGKLINKIETEYPGFSTKTTKEPLLYQGFKENLMNEAKKADDAICTQVLKKYTDFFKDPHLWVGANGAPFAAPATGKAESITINVQDFENKVKVSKDPFEGIWSTEGYKIGIKKTAENEYIGFIIEAKSISWKPGDIKFRLLPNGSFEYAFLDRSKRNGQYKLYDGSLLFLEQVGVALVKELPKPVLSTTQVAEKLEELTGFYFKKLTARTAIFKLPSFEYQYLAKIGALIDQHKTELENSENLIIDLRGNPGGTTDAYQKLLPYVSGKTIRHTGAEFLATQTYINNLETYKKSLDKNASTEGINKQIAKLKANLGKFVNFSATGGPTYTEEVVQAPKAPKNIIVLADKGTGSSAEYFLFIAKQSKKVKILGIPSYGALDYGNAYLIDFGCPGYQLLMPTYRALRLPDYPIDNIGFQPDVSIDSAIKDWIAFAVQYVEE